MVYGVSDGEMVFAPGICELAVRLTFTVALPDAVYSRVVLLYPSAEAL